MKYEVKVTFDLDASVHEDVGASIDFPEQDVDMGDVEEKLRDSIRWFFQTELNDIFAENGIPYVDVKISDSNVKLEAK